MVLIRIRLLLCENHTGIQCLECFKAGQRFGFDYKNCYRWTRFEIVVAIKDKTAFEML